MQNKDAAMEHLNSHVTYPATKNDLVTSCNNMSEFSDADKKEFADMLPDKSYNSADEVKAALGW